MNLKEAVETLVDYYSDEMEPNRYVSEAWQTLKTAVLAQQTNNTAMPKCNCRGCMNPKIVGICDCCGGIVTNHPALRQ